MTEISPFLALDKPINKNVRSDLSNKAVQSALKIVSKNNDIKIIRDNKNLLIQQLIEEGFDVIDPKGTKKVSSKMLQQAIWRTVNRTKPLDFSIHVAEMMDNQIPREAIEQIITAGVSTVMDMGGYTRSLTGKEGVFQKMVTFGDGMMMVGTDPDKDQDSPIIFNPISNSNIYTDSYATSIRNGGWGRTVDKMIVIFSMSWAQAIEMYPKLEKRGGTGKIPRDSSFIKELERNYIQTFKLDDMVEIAHYYDLSNKHYACFAGSQCTLLEEYKEDEYPWVLNGLPYVPVLQWMCMPSYEGFWNYGIGNILYDLAIVHKRLLNMAVSHAEDNVYPYALVNVPQGEAARFFNKLQLAGEMRAKGMKAWVPMEYDPSNPNSGRVSAESLTTQSLLNEWQILTEALTREVSRCGVVLDDTDRGAGFTASQVISEEENSNAFVKQMMEYNAPETKFAVELTMDMMKKSIRKTNKTPIRLSTDVEIGKTQDGTPIQTKMNTFTLGEVADFLKKYEVFVEVNSRSGAIPSNIMRQAQIDRVLQLAPPNSPAWGKLQVARAQLNGQNLKMEDFIPAAPEGAPAGGPAGAPAGAPPSDTDRLQIPPRAGKEPAMAF